MRSRAFSRVAILVAAAFSAAAAPAGAEFGEGTSALFALDLGPFPIRPGEAPWVSGTGAPLLLYLGPGYATPASTTTGEGTSPSFALRLVPLSGSEATSLPFALDLRVLMDVTAPESWPPAPLPTPRTLTITWDVVAGIVPDHFAVFYRTHESHGWRLIRDDCPAGYGPYACPWNVPPIGTAHLRVKVEARDAFDNVLGQAESEHDQVLYNESGVQIDYRSPLSGERSESRAVLAWGEYPNAESYTVLIDPDETSACAYGHVNLSVPFLVPTDPSTGKPPPYLEIPSGTGIMNWEGMEPARFEATITANLAGGSSWELETQPFIKVRLHDVYPNEADGAQPILMVHGWTSDLSTWFDGTATALLPSLKIGVGAEKRHPWMIEYPNIGSIAESGAGVGDAILYLESLSGWDDVMVVAHSMGGLVTRTYLQGKAVRPRYGNWDPPAYYPAFRDDVSRFVTLSTPHQGEWLVGFTSLLRSSWDCPDVDDSRSMTDLTHTKEFLEGLNAVPLPDNVEYFLTAGTATHGEFAGNARNDLLTELCSRESDGTVDVCSALGGVFCQGEHQNPVLDFGSNPGVRYQFYRLGHTWMGHPGLPMGNDEAARLLDDVLAFVRKGASEVPTWNACPPYDWTSFALSGSQGAVSAGVLPGSSLGASAAPVLRGRRDVLPNRPIAIGTSRRTAAPLVGVQARIRAADDPDSTSGFLVTTDPQGEVSLRLAPGEYRASFAGSGFLPREEWFTVPDSSSTFRWAFDLDPDPAYLGPEAPRLEIDGGAFSTPDSVVSVTLQCTGATEYQLSEQPDFEGADWLPLEPVVSWTFSSEEGTRFLFARYRSAPSATTEAVSARIAVGTTAAGSIQVDSSPTPAAILLDDMPTGLTTPATLIGVPEGYHRVSLLAPGMFVEPPIHVVEVTDGQASAASFDVIVSLPPGPVDLQSLGQGPYLSASPLRWDPSTDPESGPNVFYNVTFYADVMGADPLQQRLGIAATSVDASGVLPDSMGYWVSVEAVDPHGVAQDGPLPLRGFLLDQTVPVVSLIRPVSGDTLAPGTVAELATDVSDWSGADSLVATLSVDGGVSFPDTVFQGEWAPSVDWTVPPFGREEASVIRVEVTDLAGNAGHVDSGPFLIFDGVTSVGVRGTPVDWSLSLPFGNPFRNRSWFELGVPRATFVGVRVYDVAGRRVRTLAEDVHAAGWHRVAWDGRDERGAHSAPGVYFVRMSAGSFAETRKVVLLR